MTDRDLEVWIVDDEQSVRWVLEKALRQANMQSRSFERGEHLRNERLQVIETIGGGSQNYSRYVCIRQVRRKFWPLAGCQKGDELTPCQS